MIFQVRQRYLKNFELIKQNKIGEIKQKKKCCIPFLGIVSTLLHPLLPCSILFIPIYYCSYMNYGIVYLRMTKNIPFY